MKRILITIFATAQPVIASLLAGNDLTRTGVDASGTYLITLIVGSYTWWAAGLPAAPTK